MENFNIFIRSIFVDNMIFAYFLGMCSFLAVSKNVKTALGLGVAVSFMLTITLPVNYLLQEYVLKPGALVWLGEEFAEVDLSFLSLIMFIAVIASMTQLVEMSVEKFSPSLYASLGIFDSRRLAVHATARLLQRVDSYLCRRRMGLRMAARDCCHSRYPRTSSGLQQHSASSSRNRNHFYHHSSDGHCVHELPGHQDISKWIY